jgi:hypothetical protein
MYFAMHSVMQGSCTTITAQLVSFTVSSRKGDKEEEKDKLLVTTTTTTTKVLEAGLEQRGPEKETTFESSRQEAQNMNSYDVQKLKWNNNIVDVKTMKNIPCLAAA